MTEDIDPLRAARGAELTLPEQARIVAALMHALRTARPQDAVELLETHISFIVLAGAWAYKIKKAVDLGFLDFTTLAKRRYFCEEELRLNRRTAASIYLEIVPITCAAGEPLLGGSGPAIEVALKMRAFAQNALWERQLAQGRFEPRHVDELARTLCEFHEHAAVAGADSPHGAPAQARTPMLDTLRALDELLSASQRERLAALRSWEARAFADLERPMQQRRLAGRVRECHGDLHLGNVTTLEGRPTLFDCLEFDPALRWTDVMSDVGFLAMDLHAHARADLAQRFVNAYFECGGDYDGARVLRYHVVYRALVRAKVAALRRGQTARERGRDGGPGAASAARAVDAYLDVAWDCIAPGAPTLFIAHGYSGSGKTTWTGQMLEATGAVRIRADVERKRLAGLAPLASSASAWGSGLYSDATNAATHARLREAASCVLLGGFHAIIDATFLQAQPREQARALARELGVRFAILDFQASDSCLRERIVARAQAGQDASEADLAVLDHQLAHAEPLAADERADVFGIDAQQPFSRELLTGLAPPSRR